MHDCDDDHFFSQRKVFRSIHPSTIDDDPLMKYTVAVLPYSFILFEYSLARNKLDAPLLISLLFSGVSASYL